MNPDISVSPVEACVIEGLTPQTPGLKPRPSRCFFGQGTFVHFVSLHPGEHKLVSASYSWGEGLCDGLASRPGGSSNTPRHVSC